MSKAYICDIEAKPIIEIKAGRGSLANSLKEISAYRGLLYTLALRDFKVRYAQTKLGYAWALIQPLTALAVLYLVFQKALGSGTQNISFLAYSLSGLLFWNFFSYNFSQGSSALIQARSMLQKIYFPRQILVLSKGLVGLSDLGIALILFLALGYAEIQFQLFSLLQIILALTMTFMASQGLALWMSALSIRFRDLQQVVPFIVQMLFFLSPIAYDPKLWKTGFSEELYGLFYLNPMQGILELARSAFFDLELNNDWVLMSLLYCLVLFLSGWIYFQRVERKMADLL